MVGINLFPFVVALSLSLQAQAPLEARVTAANGILERFFRGERLEEAQARSNRDIEAFNARARVLQAELEEARKRMEAALVPARVAYAQLQELDKALKNIPPGMDQDVIKRKVEGRNVLAGRVNALNAEARPASDEYTALAGRLQPEMDRDRQGVMVAREALNARITARQAFERGGQDLAFFNDLNRLLADIRHSLRATPAQQGLQKLLAKVRGFRRELAMWAIAGQVQQPNGLVLVEALVGDEPCWMVVDTGAMDTILNPEVAEAAGLGGHMGEDARLTVVGGLRIKGRSFKIPRLAVRDQVQSDVQAAAVRPSDVGIDGLLGQSFLKAFVYMIDERSAGRLILTRR